MEFVCVNLANRLALCGGVWSWHTSKYLDEGDSLSRLGSGESSVSRFGDHLGLEGHRCGRWRFGEGGNRITKRRTPRAKEKRRVKEKEKRKKIN